MRLQAKAHQLAKFVYDLEVQKAHLTHQLRKLDGSTVCNHQVEAQSAPDRIKAKLRNPADNCSPFHHAATLDKSGEGEKKKIRAGVFSATSTASLHMHVDASTLRALLRKAESELSVLTEENEVKEKELLRVLASLHAAQTREGQLQRVIESHQAQLSIVHEALSQSHHDIDAFHKEIIGLKSRPHIEEERLLEALKELAQVKAENDSLNENVAELESLLCEKESMLVELMDRMQSLQQLIDNIERFPARRGHEIRKRHGSRVAVRSIIRVLATVRVLVAITSMI